MTVKFEDVKADDVLYDVHSQRTPIRGLSEMGSWPVKVIAIDHEEGFAMVSWNYNRPVRYSRRSIEKLRRTPYKPRQ